MLGCITRLQSRHPRQRSREALARLFRCWEPPGLSTGGEWKGKGLINQR